MGVTTKNSGTFGLRTKYLRSVFDVELKRPFESANMRKAVPNIIGSASLRGTALFHNDVFVSANLDTDKLNLHAFLTLTEFDYLSSEEGASVLVDWVSLLTFDEEGTVNQQLCHQVSVTSRESLRWFRVMGAAFIIP